MRALPNGNGAGARPVWHRGRRLPPTGRGARVLRRWRRHRHADEQRARLADDVRRLAGFADVAAQQANRLGADVPEGVAACALVWHHWARRLAELGGGH
jgi:hypothetical protein